MEQIVALVKKVIVGSKPANCFGLASPSSHKQMEQRDFGLYIMHGYIVTVSCHAGDAFLNLPHATMIISAYCSNCSLVMKRNACARTALRI